MSEMGSRGRVLKMEAAVMAWKLGLQETKSDSVVNNDRIEINMSGSSSWKDKLRSDQLKVDWRS